MKNKHNTKVVLTKRARRVLELCRSIDFTMDNMMDVELFTDSGIEKVKQLNKRLKYLKKRLNKI